jgi:hypothetical protein
MTQDEINQQNKDQHEQIFKAIEANNKLLVPISETYKTVGLMAKWLMAFLVFLSMLGGVIVAWGKIFNKE